MDNIKYTNEQLKQLLEKMLPDTNEILKEINNFVKPIDNTNKGLRRNYCRKCDKPIISSGSASLEIFAQTVERCIERISDLVLLNKL